MPDPFDARETIEANIVSGDIDDDVAVFTVAGLIGDFATLRARLASCEAALDKIIRKNRSIVGSGRQRVESDGEFAAIARAAVTKGGEDA